MKYYQEFLGDMSCLIARLSRAEAICLSSQGGAAVVAISKVFGKLREETAKFQTRGLL